MNHYEALGVPKSATAAEIRKAYLQAARKHHPDFHVSDDAADRSAHAARMQALTQAWAVLGDPKLRAAYDDSTGRAHGSAAGSASERQRVRPGPQAPAGKGWTPRAGDDGWMDDFGAWADERDRPPDDDPAPGRRDPLAVVPVAIFAIGVACGIFGMIFESRPMVAACIAAVIVSSVLFIVMPLVAMTRRRPPPAEPSATAQRTPYSRS